MSDPKCPWCGESHPTDTIRVGEIEVTTCPRLGANEAVMFAPEHRVTPADFEALAKAAGEIERIGVDATQLRDEFVRTQAKLAGPIVMVRLEDGSQVVAFAPVGLEVRAFGAEDLDERGIPLEKT